LEIAVGIHRGRRTIKMQPFAKTKPKSAAEKLKAVIGTLADLEFRNQSYGKRMTQIPQRRAVWFGSNKSSVVPFGCQSVGAAILQVIPT